LARAFRDDLRSNPPDADYAILAEYYVNPDGRQANAVHFVICEKSGGWVLADFQNSTHEDFKTIAPKSVKDCDRLAVQRLAKRLIIPEAAAEARANPKKAPDSEACTAIANTAPAVNVTTGDATAPTGTGGTVEDGTYYLTAVVRTPASIIPQIKFRQTIRTSGNTLEMTAENSNKPAFTSVRTFTTSGSSIVFARVCSTDVGMQTETQFNSYTADATHFSLYSIGLGITVTYTKQPSE